MHKLIYKQIDKKTKKIRIERVEKFRSIYNAERRKNELENDNENNSLKYTIKINIHKFT